MKRIPKPKKVSVERHSALNKTEKRTVRKVFRRIETAGSPVRPRGS